MGHASVHGADGEFAGVFQREVRGDREVVADHHNDRGHGAADPIHATIESGAARRAGSFGADRRALFGQDEPKRDVGQKAKTKERRQRDEGDSPERAGVTCVAFDAGAHASQNGVVEIAGKRLGRLWKPGFLG